MEEAVTLEGLSVTPAGSPEEDNPMLAAKPFDGVMVSALVPVEPATTDALVADMLKSGLATTAGVRVYLAV